MVNADSEDEDEVLAEIAEAIDHLHPLWRDRIENERCPNCGTPGRPTHNGNIWPLEEWACPACEPEAFADE
jgi:hypothetical protein